MVKPMSPERVISDRSCGRRRMETISRVPAGSSAGRPCRRADKPGPYVIRVKVPSAVKLMPHKHPEDRIYTVLSGAFYIGLGEWRPFDLEA